MSSAEFPNQVNSDRRLLGIPINGNPTGILNSLEFNAVTSQFDWVVAGGGANTLAGLTDTDIAGLADGDLILFDTADAKWHNKVLSGDITVTKAGVVAIGALKVTNAMLAGAIAVGKLANGVDGELITWDAAGVAATVAAGAAGEILTSNGAGAAPTFQAAGASSPKIIGYDVPNVTGQNVSYMAPYGSPGTLSLTESLVSMPIEFALTITRHIVFLSVNAKTGDVEMTLRDDAVDIAATALTLTAGVTGEFNSGVISDAIVAGSAVTMERDSVGSGAGNFVGVSNVYYT